MSGQSSDWLTLDEDEEILWRGEPHFYSILPSLVLGILFAIVVVGLVVIAEAYLKRKNTEYVMTSAGLYRKRGIISRDVQKIEFDKIQNISFSQGALGNYFGYGNVDISTAGGSGVEMEFRSVPDPKTVQKRINEQIRKSRDRGQNGSQSRQAQSAVLDEILAELQTIRQLLEADVSKRESDRIADSSDRTRSSTSDEQQ